MLKVTLDVFSGRPNPEWIVEGDEAKDLLREIGETSAGALDEGFQGLGYRGVIVEAQSDTFTERYGLPSAFRIGHKGDAKGLQTVERILGSMRKANSIADDVQAFVRKEIETLGARGDASIQDGRTEAAAQAKAALASCRIEVGAFNPGFWNDPAYVYRNNCYNYASNRRTNTFAQPGRASGAGTSVMQCANVTTAAMADGLHHRYDCFPDSEAPRWLMALVVAPDWDYHWYRLQKEGFWGHKPGGTPARNYDNNGAIVWNPETAARAPYTNFCGYFYACRSQRIN